jgi:hypothetical protein
MAHVAPVLLYIGIYLGCTFADAGATPNAIIGFGVLVLLAAALQQLWQRKQLFRLAGEPSSALIGFFCDSGVWRHS